ncbi:MAG: SDR family NAD(P)-dependent oxidoreductase [Promethearchaeia archaeon]
MKKEWYKDKVFVITGASGDIGSAVCREFARLGMRMYLLDLPNPKLDKLVEELQDLGAHYVETMEMDVTNKSQVESVIERIGKKEKYIDILHNNAGVGSMCSLTNGGTFEQYRKVMSINVDGIWLVLQAARPYIGRPAPTDEHPDRREGQLIFTSSSGGKTGIPNMAAYTASKHAVVGLADSLRREYKMKGHNIQVITICPAPVKTKFWEADPETKKWVEIYEEKGGLYKLVEPEDVAEQTVKASRKYKKELFIPRLWHVIEVLELISKDYVAKKMIEIEKSKEEEEV